MFVSSAIMLDNRCNLTLQVLQVNLKMSLSKLFHVIKPTTEVA
jgi:hypothetical protein